MDIAEFRRLGYLQEANRLFFHPLGLALEVVREEDGRESLSGIWDFREDPEGLAFGIGVDAPEPQKAVFVALQREQRRVAREVLFGGSDVQPA
jgi:hypothetical protein